MSLEHIDMLIAFAAVMTGVSLLVTVLVQMMVAALGLRGHNLRSGLNTLLAHVAPELGDGARALSQEVLLHPLISDSAMVRQDSILLRVLPVSWIKQFDPLVKLLLRWRLATTIRLDELINILGKMSAGLPSSLQEILTLKEALKNLRAQIPGGNPVEIEKSIQRLIGLLPPDSEWRARIQKAGLANLSGLKPSEARDPSPGTGAETGTGPKPGDGTPGVPERNLVEQRLDPGLHVLENIEQKLALAAAVLRMNTEADTNTKQVIQEMKDAFGDLSNKDVVSTARHLFPHLAMKAEQAAGDLRNWFGSTMDRSSQHFVVHTRIWTAVFAMMVAVILQLDSLELLRRLSSDAELRSRLVASAETLNRKADDLQISTSSTTPPARVYVEAMRLLVQNNTNVFRSDAQPAGFTNLAGAESWLRTQLQRTNLSAATNAALVQDLLVTYRNLVPQAELRVAADRLQSLMSDDLVFELIPDPYPWSPWEFVRSLWHHFPGILGSAALLSLGAPFWFNLLKTLSNLRPVLAQKEEKEAKSS